MGTPATLAAKQATTTIPIVMESLSDVISTGVVTNLARPGGNVTGVSGFAPELSGKRLELIRQLFPRADRVAVLTNRANPATIAILRATESAAQQIRMTLHVTDVRQAAEQANRTECGKQLASREDSAKRLGTVGEASAQRPGDEPDRCTRGEQYPELLGREPSSFEESRHEWRGDAERCVHECVENGKTV